MDLLKRVLSRTLATAAVFACLPAHARELERYLIESDHLPSGCQRIYELLPLNDKVSKLYEGAYRSVVPAPVDRHTQSLDCGGQKGTLYFYQYRTLNDKEQALLFARPVLTQPAGTPQIIDWNGGFVVVSFAQIPEALRQRLLEKTGGGQTISSSTAAPAAQSTAVPVVTSTSAPVVPSEKAVIPSSGTAAAIPAPLPTPLPPPVPAPAEVSSGTAPSPPPLETPDDIAKEVLDKVRKSIDCRDRTLPPELIQVCEWIEAFRKGKTVSPAIASTDARIGLGYRVDGFGRLDHESYQAAIGTGGVGEIGFVPLYPATGVEELELRAAATGAPNPRPLPSDILRRIENAPRPTGRTFIPTNGKSWLARRPDQTLYLRRSGKQWIILSLDNKTDGPAEHSDFTLTSFPVKD
jgi:hypothetical protein